MKFCPICGAPNPEDRTVCEQCGAHLSAISEVEGGILCSVCGYRNPPGTIFCEQCGARLESEATPETEGSSGAEAREAVELNWVAALEELFPEIPEAQPPASETMPAGAGLVEEAAPPSAVEEKPPAVETVFTTTEEEEEEPRAPSAPEVAPGMPSAAEGSLPPFEGIPPEIAESWPLAGALEEEAESFPFLGVSPAEEGEGPLPFLWPETPGEAGEQGPEVPVPGTAPFTEWPSELEWEGLPSSLEIPPVEPPPEMRTETEAVPPLGTGAEAFPAWLEEWREAGQQPEEAIPEVPFGPFEAEESPPVAPEGPAEAEQPALTEVFLSAAETPVEAPSAPAEVPPFTDLEAVLAEMPEWLQTLQPVPEEEGPAPSEATPAVEPAGVETRGPLAGLVDVLPLNPRLVEILGPAARLRSEPSPELLTRAQAWQSLRDQGLSFLPGERAVELVPAGLGAALERWLLFALLIGALILGLYWPLPFFQTALLTPPQDFLSQLDRVPSGGIALVAVDYGPDRAAELELYLQQTLDRLTARGIRVVTVSLSPWGAAQAALAVQARSDYGEQVVHLGYYPGQEVGVARLLTRPLDPLGVDYRGQPLQGLPLARDLGEGPLAGRLSVVVLITGSPEALRGWIQQARAVLSPQVPIIAAIGANIAPYAAPYRESGQLQAVAIGLRDALLLNGPVREGSPAFFDLQAQTLLQVLIVALIGVGLVIRLVGGGRGAP